MAESVDHKLDASHPPNRTSQDGTGLVFKLHRAGKAHLHAIVPILLSLTLFSWFITRGDWRFFDLEGLSTYYDALGDSLLQGRLDVPRTAILPEAFVREGKSYGYFGVTPALIRIPLNFLFDSRWGQWARVSMTFACLLSLIFTYRILILQRGEERLTHNPKEKAWIGIFLLAAGSGSTMLFLASRAFVYHEAIIWGSTLSLISVFFLLKYQIDNRLSLLALAGASAFLAFSARPTSGAGAILAISGLAVLITVNSAARRTSGRASHWLTRTLNTFGVVDMKAPPAHALWAASFALLTACLYFGTNYLKFHTWDGVPLKYYAQYRQMPERMLLTGGKQFHLANLPTGLAAYFGRIGVDWGPHFPWVFMRQRATLYPGARIDVNDWSSGIPGTMPALFGMSCIGAWILIRRTSAQVRQLRLPVLALGLGGSLIFFTVWIYERYLHDLYPFLVLTGIVGLNCVMRLRHPRLTTIALVIFFVLTLASISVNTSFALEYQREIVWGVEDDKRAEFQRWRAVIDDSVRLNRPTPGHP